MTTDTEWEYIPLTREQSMTLWKDVPLYWISSGAIYHESLSQKEHNTPSDRTYYLRVKKESTSDNA